jgi:uncharacterized protein (DUF2164 family)
VKRKWDLANEEVQRKCIDEIVARLDEASDSAPGVIIAQDLIDIMTENLAPSIYNAGLREAKKAMLKKVSDIETDIDILEAS